MRFVVLVTVFFFMGAPIAQAQETAAPNSNSKASPDRVQLVEDDENGRLLIVIDGKEVGRIDASGLLIEGNINYSGLLSDVGSAEARADGAAAAGDAH